LSRAPSGRQADYRIAITAGAAAAVGTERGEPIVRAAIGNLKLRRIIVPPAPLVERFALAGRAFARRHAHRELIRGLDAGMRQRLEALLTIRVEDGRTTHGWIGEVAEGPKLKNLVAVVERLSCLRPIGLPDDRREAIHANRYGIIAREAKITHARELLRFSTERRPSRPSPPSSSSARPRSPISRSRCSTACSAPPTAEPRRRAGRGCWVRRGRLPRSHAIT
jgi:hypothetical protein